MKLILGFGAILIVLACWFLYGYPRTLSGMQACIDQATIAVQTDLTTLQTDSKSREAMCDKAKSQYSDLSSCYSQVFTHYFIPTQLVETIMVKRHPNFPVLERNYQFLSRACPAK